MNDVNKCYRLKLFLQQFFIGTAVLNAQVPANSRIHIIEEFNRGAYDYLIATDALVDTGEEDEKLVNDDDDGDDENEGLQDGDVVVEEDDQVADDADVGVEEGNEEPGDESEGENFDEGDEPSDEEPMLEEELPQEEPSEKHPPKELKKTSTKQRTNKEDAEYGVSRGIDFNGVGFVINFDFPATAAAYTHRVGRTARGGASGTSLSFVIKADGAKGRDISLAARDAKILAQVRAQQPRIPIFEGDNVLGAMAGEAEGDNFMQPAPLLFNLKELEGFRYRVEDTLKSVTGIAVKEFRAAEVKREILNSERLKTFFVNNPNDLKALRHDKAILHPIRQKEHLKHVPDYLVPASMRSVVNIKERKRKGKRSRINGTQEQRIKKSKLNDPLINLSHDSQVAQTTDDLDKDEGQALDRPILTDKEISSGGLSGRKQWKMRHRKGKFNPKIKSKNNDRVPGTFMKSRKRSK